MTPDLSASGGGRFTHLDGLRGYFALMVAAGHFNGVLVWWHWPRLFSGGHLAVSFFFILSGFVLAHMLRMKAPGWGEMMGRRFVRLWPLHAVTTTLMCLLLFVESLRGRWVPPDWPLGIAGYGQNLLFLSDTGWVGTSMLNDPAWSISAEFWVSAFLVYGLYRLPSVALLALAALGYGSLMSFGEGLNLIHQPYLFTTTGMIRGLTGISLGVALYKERAGLTRMLARVPAPAIPPLLIALLAVMTAGMVLSPGTPLDLVAVAAIVPFFAIGLPGEPDGLALSWLNARPMQWLGKISFALYLSHMAVVVSLPARHLALHLGHVATLLILLALACGLAACLEAWVERPSRAFGNALIRKAMARRRTGAAD